MDYRAYEMKVFITVVDHGNFSAAARELGRSPSAISKLITRLEMRLGSPLLVRTTRALLLTYEGAIYVDKARYILNEIDDLENLASSNAHIIPRGRLHVSASVGFGECFILPIVSEFLEFYPQIEFNLSLEDRVVDLIEEGVDVGIRSGLMRDSTLKARKLIESDKVLVASKAYLNKYGHPKTPDDLKNHNCLQFNFRHKTTDWPFKTPQTNEKFTKRVTGNAAGNNGVILRQYAKDHIGIARLGRFHVAEDIKNGELIPVLDDYNSGEIEQIHAIYVDHKFISTRNRVFIDFIASKIKYTKAN